MDGAVSGFKLSGHVHAILREKGVIVLERDGENLIVDGGTLRVVNLLGGGSSSPIVQMICGSGSTWPSPQTSMTALANQPGGSVAKTFGVGDITYGQPTSGSAFVNFRSIWAETENNAFVTNEVGLFAAGPIMIARFVFASPGITKQNNQSLEIDYTITARSS